MKTTFLVFLLISLNCLAQNTNERTNSNRHFSVGILFEHHLLNRSDQLYSVSKTSSYSSDVSNRSYTQLYGLQLSYNFKNSFLRANFGTTADYVQISQSNQYFSGDFFGSYYWTSSTKNSLQINDINTSFTYGLMMGTHVSLFDSNFSFGMLVGLNYTHYYHRNVISNHYTSRHTYSSGSPSGSSSSTSFVEYTENDPEITNKFTRRNNVRIGSRFGVYLGYKISDRLGIELGVSPQMTFIINDGALTQMKLHLPVFTGLHYNF